MGIPLAWGRENTLPIYVWIGSFESRIVITFTRIIFPEDNDYLG